MRSSRVINALGLFAALVGGAAASPISTLQQRTSIAAGTLIESNCPEGWTGPFCNFQYLSYADTAVQASEACQVFNSTCDSYGGKGTTILKHCSNDELNSVITASCVKAECSGLFFSLTGRVGFDAPGKALGQLAFYPVDKCDDGQGYCQSLIDKSDPVPRQFVDPNPPVDTCQDAGEGQQVTIDHGVLEARTTYAKGTKIESNCPPGSTDLFCDFKYLSYLNSEVEAHEACKKFNATCDLYSDDGTTVTKHCSNDKNHSVITASCVQKHCEGTFFSYTSRVPFDVRRTELPKLAFYPVEKCGDDGKHYCETVIDKTDPEPRQFEDPNPPKDTCVVVIADPPR